MQREEGSSFIYDDNGGEEGKTIKRGGGKSHAFLIEHGGGREERVWRCLGPEKK